MPSTGSTSPGSRSNVQLRQSCSGPQMPIDSASSRPSSRRTIIVRFAHGHARATTSRYRPASAASVPSRPSAVIRPFRYRVSRTNSPVAPTLPTLPHCSAFQIPPPPPPAPPPPNPPPPPPAPTPPPPPPPLLPPHPHPPTLSINTATPRPPARPGPTARPPPSPGCPLPHPTPQTEFNARGPLPILFGSAPLSLARAAARPARAGGLADAVPKGALLAGRVAGRREGVAQ